MWYGRLARNATEIDAAVGRIRLAGMDLGDRELGGLRRIRLLVGRMNALALSCEAHALAADPDRRDRVRLLASLLEGGRLEVRIAPLAGWSPDFSCFRGVDPEAGVRDLRGHGTGQAVLIGPHWFERPYPHPGPALGALLGGAHARRAGKRFEETWSGGHDLRDAVGSVLTSALQRSG